MDLNHIQLKPRLVADLYSHHLLENSSQPTVRPAAAYLGKNGRQILIVVTHKSAPFLPDNELSFLTTILSACKLSLADIGIVNAERTGADELQQLLETGSKQVLLFGVPPLSIGLPISFPPFQVQPFNGRSYLYAPALPELESDKTQKLRLWNCLKNLFGI